MFNAWGWHRWPLKRDTCARAKIGAEPGHRPGTSAGTGGPDAAGNTCAKAKGKGGHLRQGEYRQC